MSIMFGALYLEYIYSEEYGVDVIGYKHMCGVLVKRLHYLRVFYIE